MRLTSLVAVSLASLLPAQEPQQGQREQSERPTLHRPSLGLFPIDALQVMKTGAAQAERESRRRPEGSKQASQKLSRKPEGAGRYLAAVVVCADADLDPAKIFGQRRKDLLILSSPGPRMEARDLALIERAVRKHRLSLCLVLTHEGCETLDQEPEDADEELWQRYLQATAELAAKHQVPMADAHAVSQSKLILAGSDLLNRAQQQGRFQVASVMLRSGPAEGEFKLAWRAAWSQRPFDSLRPKPGR
ncbi:MAG: hypothetical protein ACYTG5_07830 [Planctomycetota bacterium]|jgi:carbonic anhydrase